MSTIIITIVFFVLAIVIMGLALNFAKYKKNKSACCHGSEHKNNKCCGDHLST